MPIVARSRATEERQYTSWDRARLSVVVPIGVIVAIAIVCIVVAVLSSARRADEVAVEHETQLFSTALNNFGAGVLREVESVASSEAAVRNIRVKFDSGWVHERIGSWLETFFQHDYVFVFDAQNKPIYSMTGRNAAETAWIYLAKPELASLLGYMRGSEPNLPNAIRVAAVDGAARTQAAVIRRIQRRPAIIAAVAIRPSDNNPQLSDSAPIVASVKFIDDNVLSGIALQLRLVNLRMFDDGQAPDGDFTFQLDSPSGEKVARFAWTPKQPGAEIVHNVVPFIAVALAGFALLAAFVLRYMRRTAVAIAAGESRLRHLAMHDPLCGLPNRIFFGERLEAVIEEVRKGSTPAAVFYIDLDHFKDVNDTLGHPVGDELIRNVTLRLSRTLRGGDLVARLGGDEFAVISSVGDDSAKMMALAGSA